MPITQDRLITLVAHADTLLAEIDAARALAKANVVREALALANSALSHLDDPPARATIRQLMDTIAALTHQLSEIDIPQSLRDDVSRERIHFQKHRKANENIAYYQRYRRHAKREMTASLTQMPDVFSDLPPAATQDWRNVPSQRNAAQAQTPNPLLAAQMLRQDYTEDPAQTQRIQQLEEERKAEQEARRQRLMSSDERIDEDMRERQRNRRMIPPGEEMTIEEANALAERIRNPKAKPDAKPSGPSGPSGSNGTVDPTDNNNPANIIRHLPSPEELLDHNPAPIGKDVF